MKIIVTKQKIVIIFHTGITNITTNFARQHNTTALNEVLYVAYKNEYHIYGDWDRLLNLSYSL